MLPRYDTQLFSDIYPDYASFKATFDEDFGLYAKDCISEDSLKILFGILYARYGNNPIVNDTVDIFKAKLVAITFQKAPTWERKLALQKSLRDLSESDLLSGARTLFNRALNPETPPGTDTDAELTYINGQDVTKQKRSKLDAYSYLNDVLKADVTEDFIQSYAKLFSKFVSPTITRIYENDVEEEENNG